MKKNLLTVIFSLIAACSVETVEKTGPDGSWWLGGDDGGVFVKITDDENLNDNMYIGAIYFDGTQKIWYKGPLRLIGSIQFSPANREQYLFWDGEKLHLKDSAYLEPTHPIPPM
jgi:hypothetical protein